MSNKNNVNKDFYTMAGRDRPNEDLIVPKLPRDEGRGPRGVGSRRNFIPGAAPVGESQAPEMSAGKTGVRSGAQRPATARPGGAPPGNARPKAGASGDARRRTSKTTTAKRGRTRAATTRRSRRRAA